MFPVPMQLPVQCTVLKRREKKGACFPSFLEVGTVIMAGECLKFAHIPFRFPLVFLQKTRRPVDLRSDGQTI